MILATGRLPPEEDMPWDLLYTESVLGKEYAGLTSTGERVCGICGGQGLSSQVLGPREVMWPMPIQWSMEEAATVPIAYATAYMALVIKGDIQKGETVLIHTGAGGVGMAAIRVAHSKGAVVFTTVGSQEKRHFLLKEFPEIAESHIGNSRDSSFEHMVMKGTNGRGVDLVLNSLTGDKIDASVRCLARHGRFIEIGKLDLLANRALGTDLFLKSASFHAFFLDELYDIHPSMMGRLRSVVQEGMDIGVVQPLPQHIFHPDQVEAAFRYIGTSKHIGKVVIKIRGDSNVHGDVQRINAAPRVYFDPAKSYIVVGGLGGIGLHLINWMIKRNARNLVIVCRSGMLTAYASEFIQTWQSWGIRVNVVAMDASQMEAAVEVVEYAQKVAAPLDGIFNLALHMELGLMRNQTEASFRAVMNSKAALTRNLDQITRRVCPEMQFFVTFSSLVAVTGVQGQCSYGMANAAMDSICEQRARDGLAGKSINLGPISQAGYFHKNYDPQSSLQSWGGIGIQTVFSLIECLDVLMTSSQPLTMTRMDRRLESANGPNENLSVEDRISRLLGTNISKVNPKSKLTELGLDSIMAMEMKQLLEKDFGMNLSAAEVRTLAIGQVLEMARNNSSNSQTFTASPKTAGAGAGGRAASTASLFQLNFVQNAKWVKFLYKQCVHKVNKLTDTSQGTVFMVNSMGPPYTVQELGRRLQKPAYTMQFPQDVPLYDLERLTEYYLKELKAAEPYGPYVIAGYSAGTFMAIELAMRLQESGQVAKLVLIDQTPGRMKAVLQENFGDDFDTIEEIDMLVAILAQSLNTDREEIERVVGSLPTRQAKLQKLLELSGPILAGEAKSQLADMWVKGSPTQLINLLSTYKPKGIYRGKITLVRTLQNLIGYDSTEFWGLEKFCTQMPIVISVDSTHAHLLTEPAVITVSAAIND